MEGRQQPTLEDLLNIITLQNKALEFYATQNNYLFEGELRIIKTNIAIDNGHQARFALEQSKNIGNYSKSLIEEMKKIIDEKEKEKGEQEALDMVIKINKLMLDLGNK